MQHGVNEARRLTLGPVAACRCTVDEGQKKAIIAIAHQMLHTIYVLFTRRQAYRDSGFDYQAALVQKNASLWIKALKQFSDWPKSDSCSHLALDLA